MSNAFIHKTAEVETGVDIGQDSKVWHFSHIRTGAKIGKNCNIGKDCYVDARVTIGDGSRIQNGVSIYEGVEISPYVFIGPHVVFTNDMYPRAGVTGWEVTRTQLKAGSALGAGSIIRCGIEIGEFAMVGAGAIVTKDIEPFTLVMGTPAQPHAKICACGQKQFDLESDSWRPILECCKLKLIPAVLELAKGFA
jgi:UDP-3-O-[3-hydroxymyristoyl] glucosamine N-acyltransferase